MTSSATEPVPEDTWSSLLIVAGPSGSGKTTFTQGLYGRRLPPQILSILPQCLFYAPNMDPKFPMRLNRPPSESTPRLSVPEKPQEQGRILHYSLNRLEKDSPGYRREALLLQRYLHSTKKTVVVVTIHPDRHSLAKQYGKRLFFDRRPGGGPDNRLYELKSMLQFLKVSKIAQYFAYRFTDKVPRMYREWFSFIDSVLQLASASNSSLSCHRFVVEPYLTGTSEKAFRVLSSSPGQAASSVSR